MACEVCEHCNTAVRRGERIVREGHSYHDRCHRCFVCGETDLQNAEVFMGVIFCSGCSKRIFEGCFTARRVKTSKSKKRSHWSRTKKNLRRTKLENEKRVLELARFTSITDTLTSGKSSSPRSTETTAVTTRTNETEKTYNLKKGSTDMGTTTTVTQELLKHIHSPIEMESMFVSPAKPRKKLKQKRQTKCKKYNCSDPRVAELGASTEIAHVALRRPSEMPIIIRSESNLKRTRSHSLAYLTQESDVSGDGESKQFGPGYCSQDLVKSNHWLDRTLGSILKLPYRTFKKNILDRSSLVIMSSKESQCLTRRLKTLFHNEIAEHQGRGLKRLFSTINRRKTPYRLGWLEVMSRITEDERLPDLTQKHRKRCRHLIHSHSYRCMRTQVMKLAGPTRSELAILRTKLKNAICLKFFRNIHNFNKQFVTILISACGKRN